MKKLLSISTFLILSRSISFGQNWVPVGAGVSGNIYALDSCFNKLYAGGDILNSPFDSIIGIEAWDGTSWTGLGSGVNGSVTALLEYNGNLIVGGTFIHAGGVSANHIAMWNGSKWSALGAGLNGNVNALAIYNGNLSVGGSFDSAGGAPANNIAVWNGSSWSTIGTGLNYTVSSLAVYDSNLYVGGGSGINPLLFKWGGSVWDTVKGMYGWVNNPCVNNTITALAAYNNLLYVGGQWSDSNASADYFLGFWNGNVLVNQSALLSSVSAMCVYKDVLFAGASDIEQLNSTSFGPVGNDITGCNSRSCSCGPFDVSFPVIFAIAGYNGKLYAGGDFQASWGNAANYLLEYSGVVGINNIRNNISIKVFPNPSTGTFTFQLSGVNIPSSIEVYNMLGEKVQAASLNSSKGETTISLSDCSVGVYLYRIITTKGSLVSTGKLIKE
jgi:hypothetical protein